MALLIIISFISFGLLIPRIAGKTTLASIVETSQSAVVGVDFRGTEFSEKSGVSMSANSVDVTGLTPSWTFDRLAMNVSRFHVGIETRTIVAGGTSSTIVNKQNKGRATEIVLAIPASVLGVEIEGFVAGSALPIYVQICGYDPIKNAPNGTSYANSSLNMTTAREWRLHVFSTPVNLSAGHYFLVINGISIPSSGPPSNLLNLSRSESPTSLYVSDYTSSWQNGVQSQPLHYKLVVNWNRTCMPSELDMKVDIAGTNMTVQDGAVNGTGSMIVDGAPIAFNATTLHVPVHVNRSVDFHFDYNYTVSLKKESNLTGYVNATIGNPNTWTIFPSITRTAGKCWFTMLVPHNWYYTSVFKNDVDITNETQRMGNVLYIMNESITAGSDWQISSRSQPIPFVLTFPVTTVKLGQSISLSVTPPAFLGSFIFIVYNTLGIESYRETQTHGPGQVSFNYTIPENSYTGDGAVTVLWHNGTDAGIESATYTIITPGQSETIVAVGTAMIIIGAGFTIGLPSYTHVKRVRRRIEAGRLSIINKARDLFNLNYIIVLDKHSGVDLYEHSFGEFKLDPTLISGFLSAVSSFGLELTSTNEESQIVKLEYKNSKILMSEYKNFRITVIMKDSPSSNMVEDIKLLSYDIDEKFGKLLVNFSGETTEFQGIKMLMEKRLRVSFIAPLKVNPAAEMKLSPAEKVLFDKAMELVNSSKKETFFASMLFPGQKLDSKAVTAFFALLDKNIFVARE